MERLPKSVDYSTPLAQMPDGTINYLVSNTPVNNSSFTPGSTIIVDLNNAPAFLDPASISIRYKYVAVSATCPTAATTATLNAGIVGCPLYTPFLRVDVLCNSTVIESVNNYNTVATLLSNVSLSVSEKLGMQVSLGYAPYSGDTMDNQFDTDGIVLNAYTGSTATQAAISSTNYVSGPLIGCSIGNCEKLIPLDLCNLRLQFTLDALSNIGSSLSSDVALASYTITNFEVVYNQIQFPSHVNQQIKMNPKLRIKTKSFAVGSQAIPAGSSGTVNLYYNLRYASVRSLFLLPTPTAAAYSASKAMESVDVTNNNGSYQFQIGGVNYPMQILSTLNNKSGILNELRRAMGSLYDKNNSMSIGANEFLQTQTTITSISIPGKFYVATNLMKLTEDQAMFTGVSSTNSQINAIINLGTATTNAVNCYMIINYDAIYEIDVLTKQVTYIQ
jgi:hypothetical protein